MKKRIKKVSALFLAILMVFAAASVSAYATDGELTEITPRSITIASCVFRDFYANTPGSTVTLSRDCNFVSFQVTCASGVDSSMYAVITDLSHGGAYNYVTSFPGNGSTTTVVRTFAAGSYTITLYGTNKQHTLGLVAFST